MRKALDWFLRNKALVGKVLVAVAAALASLGYTEAAAAVSFVGSYLYGAGSRSSDAVVKARQE